ncbi:hypothetical protein L596_004270 [Steinernema carpocapsae]|uniref:Uncharacterized protein n=1 Tax=Steinernema carpocapsae TaxID=34508 RepID=A0A4U8UWU6_STECR|nr:hypothetical protein L596_004270 [Steinernema carpocapsae]
MVNKIKEIDHNEVLQTFLPLILLFRTMQEKSADNYESMMMDRLQILFRESNACLIIGIADDSIAPGKVQKFMADVDGVLGFHYGPMIKLVTADFVSIRKIRLKVEKRVRHLLAEYSSDKIQVNTTDISAVHLTISSNQKLINDLMAIPHQLQMYVGTSRCFFLKDGQLIATGNSTPNATPTINRFTSTDLKNIVEFARLSMDGAKTRRGTMEQVWLKLRQDGQRQIVNLFVVPLSDEIDLVCISSVNGSGLIEQLCTILEFLDSIKPGKDLALTLPTITVLLQKFSASLRNLLPSVAEVAATGGLYVLTRHKSLFSSH